jgi:hypothetical protein
MERAQLQRADNVFDGEALDWRSADNVGDEG